MSVVDELLAQRDRVLFGKWRTGMPVEPDEACLVEWNGERAENAAEGGFHKQHPEGTWRLSLGARKLIRAAILALNPNDYTAKLKRDGRGPWPYLYDLMRWNDRQRDRQPTLAVLDEAIRIAKGSSHFGSEDGRDDA